MLQASLDGPWWKPIPAAARADDADCRVRIFTPRRRSRQPSPAWAARTSRWTLQPGRAAQQRGVAGMQRRLAADPRRDRGGNGHRPEHAAALAVRAGAAGACYARTAAAPPMRCWVACARGAACRRAGADPWSGWTALVDRRLGSESRGASPTPGTPPPSPALAQRDDTLGLLCVARCRGDPTWWCAPAASGVAEGPASGAANGHDRRLPRPGQAGGALTGGYRDQPGREIRTTRATCACAATPTAARVGQRPPTCTVPARRVALYAPDATQRAAGESPHPRRHLGSMDPPWSSLAPLPRPAACRQTIWRRTALRALPSGLFEGAPVTAE